MQREPQPPRLTRDDRLVPHSLSSEDLQQLTQHLARYRPIGEGFLVRREADWQGRPMYVLALLIKQPPAWNYTPQQLGRLLQGAIDAIARFGVLEVIILDERPTNTYAWLPPRLLEFPGALIYLRV